MKQYKLSFSKECRAISGYRRMLLFLTLFTVFFAVNVQAQCDQIAFNFEHYEPCRFRVTYDNSTECYTQLRLSLADGAFSNWNVIPNSGFVVEVISPSELWITHTGGFLPLGFQVPLLFTLPFDLNTSINIAYLNDCAQVGCDIFGGVPIESCPDPQNASIIGVKYKECGTLPYISQTPLSGWTIELLDADGNVIGEQVTDVDGSYVFYDLKAGSYVVRETQQPGWTAKVPASGQTTIDLAASQERIVNFGNCPPVSPPCNCPAGTQPGGNAVVNGNFSGSGGFTSSYALNNAPTLQPGQYWIGSNPSQINAGFAACGDHTSGSGNMMVVNGAANQSTSIWCQTFTMAPNSTYKFEAWLASLSSASPAQLSVNFLINNVMWSQNFFAPTTTCTWEPFCIPWTNGPNTVSVTICLVNQNAATTGNDFAIDDISFRACIPQMDNCSCFQFNVVPTPSDSCQFDVFVVRNDTCTASSLINQITLTLTDTAALITSAQADNSVEVTLNPEQTEAIFTTSYNLGQLPLGEPQMIGSFNLVSSNSMGQFDAKISGPPPVGDVCTFSKFSVNVPCTVQNQPATFSKLYGAGGDNCPQKIKGFGVHTYILATVKNATGEYATFSKFLNTGVLVWAYQMDIESQLLDFERSVSDQSFLLVGHTGPSSTGGVLQDNQSLLVKIDDATGACIFSKKYAHTGAESFTRIIRDPLTAEFYVLGRKNPGPPSTFDQPMLYRMDNAGVPSLAKEYTSITGIELEAYAGLFAKANGNVVLLGTTRPGNDGLLIEVNNTGAVVFAYIYNNVGLPFENPDHDFNDGMELANGDIVVAGAAHNTIYLYSHAEILKMDNAFSVKHGGDYFTIDEFREIGRGTGTSGQEYFYGTGFHDTGTGTPNVKTTMVTQMYDQFGTGFTSPNTYYLYDGEIKFKNPRLSVSNNQIFYADARYKTLLPNGYDLLFGAFDQQMMNASCPNCLCRKTTGASPSPRKYARQTIQVSPNNLSPGITPMGTCSPLMMPCSQFCVPVIPCNMPPTCSVPPSITVNTDPGLCTAMGPYTVSGTGCGPLSIFMNCPGFTDSDFSPGNSVSISGNYVFNKGVNTCTVTVTDGLNQTATCSFTVTVVDNEKPKIICPQNVIIPNVPLCNGGAVATYPAPTVTDNCPMVTYTCSPPSGSFFPCGTTTVTCIATDMAPALNTASCTFTVTVECVCATIGMASIICDPLVDDKYIFTIPVNNLSGGSSCTYVVSGTIPGGTLMQTSPPGANPIVGMITMNTNVIPPTFNLTVTVNCICPNGQPISCTLPVTLIPICCKKIKIDNKTVCSTDQTVSIPISMGCGLFNMVQQVNWFVATGATCPPFPGGQGNGWLLQQTTAGTNACNIPLVLCPYLYSNDIWIVAVMTVGDFPCHIVQSNVACITRCKPVTCSVAPAYWEKCYLGTPITPPTLTATPNPVNSLSCPSTFGNWTLDGNNIGFTGQTVINPGSLSLTDPLHPCFKDFVYAATVSNVCGAKTCSSTVRLYDDAASIGTLDMNPLEPLPYCPGEDFVMCFKDKCTIHPPNPPMWNWGFSTIGAGGPFLGLAGAGSMNSKWWTNPLTVDHWYQVTAANGSCPLKQETYFIDMCDPLTIGTFTAMPVMNTPDCFIQGLNLTVPFQNPCCAVTVTWIKNGQVISGPTTYTGSSATFYYSDPLLNGDYSGNYWCIVESTCCKEKQVSNIVTIDPPCFAFIKQLNCVAKKNMPVTLWGMVMNPKPFVVCDDYWFMLDPLGGVDIFINSNTHIAVQAAGTYVYKVFCDDGCIKCDTVKVIFCNNNCDPVYRCCEDEGLFADVALNGVDISLEEAPCKAILRVGNLPDCDYLDKIIWGDGAESIGTFVAGDSAQHTYSGIGPYDIIYHSVETDPDNGMTCFTKAITQTIQAGCFVGTADPGSPHGIRIFPNPNTGEFNVELTETAAPGTVFKITDPTGRLVLQKPVDAGSQRQLIQATALPAGMYFLQVVTEGKITAVGKFVIQ